MLTCSLGYKCVPKMITGKAIAKALRGNFPLQCALRLTILNSLLQEEIVFEDDLKTVKVIYQSIIDGNTPLDEFKNCKVLEDQQKNWQNHPTFTLQMLNLFAATGHINYTKSGMLYLQMMSDLPSTFPDLHEQFTKKRISCCANAVAEDTRLSNSWRKDDRKCCVDMGTVDAMTTLTGNKYKTSNQDAELGKNRMKRDNYNFEKIRPWIKSHTSFDENEHALRCIATGVTTTEGDGINCDDAESVGEAIEDQLLYGILYSESKTKKKEQIKTLEALEVGLRVDKDKVHVDPLLLFSRRLLVLIEREEDI
ncbi:unnamed protein product [Lepeophtheirus salmonis]|uniref:(salmon louse) hypothetical protein n=1 Tax=Lepeophtheirus salmonis TaxID=72036 RepID=A0A817FBM6_LEPSM|nr:unnamed protein product [Lepeophtheirus salmonis]